MEEGLQSIVDAPEVEIKGRRAVSQRHFTAGPAALVADPPNGVPSASFGQQRQRGAASAPAARQVVAELRQGIVAGEDDVRQSPGLEDRLGEAARGVSRVLYQVAAVADNGRKRQLHVPEHVAQRVARLE